MLIAEEEQQQSLFVYSDEGLLKRNHWKFWSFLILIAKIIQYNF
jgi:hypothetical protein